MKKRSVAAVVILSLITCGIYSIYWTYVTTKGLQEESGVRSRLSPALLTILMAFASSAAGALLGFDCDATINALKVQRGTHPSDNFVLWVVFGAFIPVVTIGMVQNEINNLPDRPVWQENTTTTTL